MAWVRIHDGALSHPKITGLIDLTNPFTLWVWGLTNCQMHLTDGLIVRDAVPKAALQAARNLVRRGLWEPHDVGWKVHDYLSWNDCRDLVLERQAQAKARKDAWLAKQKLERANKKNGTRSERIPNASGTDSERVENAQPNQTKPNQVKKEQERAAADSLADIWNTHTTKPIAKCTKLTPKRRSHIRARFYELPADQWAGVVDRIEASAFMRGQNDKGWVVSFDWLIEKPDSWVKVLEGKYDNRRPTGRVEPPMDRTCRHSEPPCDSPGNWACQTRDERERVKAEMKAS